MCVCLCVCRKRGKGGRVDGLIEVDEVCSDVCSKLFGYAGWMVWRFL